MADYYPLIDKAVAGLDRSTGEARRALYERAREALVAQLRAVTPALSEPEIRRERLALEEAIRKVEAEAARRSRNDPLPPRPPLPPRQDKKPPPPRQEQEEHKEHKEASPPPSQTPLPEPETAAAEQPPPPPSTQWGPHPLAPGNPVTGRLASPLSAAAVNLDVPARDEKTPGSPSSGDVPEPPRVERTRWTPGGGPLLSERGLKGFRDVIAESETLGDATTQAAKTVRATLQRSGSAAARPEVPRGERRPDPRRDLRQDSRAEPRDDLRLGSRTEPGAEPQGEPVSRGPSRRPSPRDAGRIIGREAAAEPTREPIAESEPEPRESRRSRAVEAKRPTARRTEPPPFAEPHDLPADTREPDESDFDTSSRLEFPTRPPSSMVRQEDIRARMPTRPDFKEERATPPAVKRPPGQWKRTASIAIAVLLALAVVGIGAWKGYGIIASLRGGSARVADATSRSDAGARAKITDRAPPGPYTAQSAPEAAPVAQRVVLYEEDPVDPNGKRYVGSAAWRVDRMPPSPGQKPEVAVRADIEVPEQKMAVRWSLRRSDDNGAASHTIEVTFTLPPDFPHGSVANIPGVLMKQSEASRGTPLAGLVVKVTNNFFLIGLSSVENDMQRNVQLLKEREWFDVPVVYGDGKRAIIAIEKGRPGDRAFADAFAAWGQ